MKVDTGAQGDLACAVGAQEKVYSEIQEQFYMSCDLLMLEPGVRTMSEAAPSPSVPPVPLQGLLDNLQSTLCQFMSSHVQYGVRMAHSGA